MNIAIYDENEKILIDIKNYIDEYARIRNIVFNYYEYNSVSDIFSSKIPFDLIFWDIQADNKYNIERTLCFKKNNKNAYVVFISSDPQVVSDIFVANPFGFLIKPIERDKLYITIDRFVENYFNEKCLIIKNNQIYTKIYINDIIYIEASGKKCYIRDKNGLTLFNGTLSHIKKMLPDDFFFRSSRSYIINLNYIKSFDSTKAIFTNNECAVISHQKLSKFKNTFFDFNQKSNLEKKD